MYIIDAIMYANLLTMMTIGFTLTYIIAKIPNFAHGTFAVIGIYVTYTVSEIGGLNPYLSIPLSFFVVGGVALTQYFFIIRPLIKMKATRISLTITTIAMEIIIFAVVNVYIEYIRKVYAAQGLYPVAFLLKRKDFTIFNLPGVFIVSSILIITITTLLYLMLTKTKFGIAMRATVEDSELASVMGVDVNKVNAFAWFLPGGLAGMAGSIMPLWFQAHSQVGSYIIISTFAGSILGGISSIYGAIIGGFIVGLSETLGVIFLSDTIGSWITAYRLLIPLTILAVTLLILPKGFTGLIEDYMDKRILSKLGERK
jgi:branched-chain amino acid transport system permease protein